MVAEATTGNKRKMTRARAAVQLQVELLDVLRSLSERPVMDPEARLAVLERGARILERLEALVHRRPGSVKAEAPVRTLRQIQTDQRGYE